MRNALKLFKFNSSSRAIRVAYTSTHAPALLSKPCDSLLEPPPPRTKSLSGTVPHHTSYLLLHTLKSPEKWPSIFQSRLYVMLQRKIRENGGLVNFCWAASKSNEGLGQNDHDETYRATFWKAPQRGRLACRIEVPMVSINNVEEIFSKLFSDNHCGVDYEEPSEPYIYVCTHARRDCRCGVRGSEFAESLRKELRNRGMLLDLAGNSRVGEIGHVGGHKNAPNIIVFPQGDWYGNLQSSDIPALLDHWLTTFRQPPTCRLLDGPNLLQWRGRMGMTKEAQALAISHRD